VGWSPQVHSEMNNVVVYLCGFWLVVVSGHARSVLLIYDCYRETVEFAMAA